MHIRMLKYYTMHHLQMQQLFEKNFVIALCIIKCTETQLSRLCIFLFISTP